MKNHGWRSFEEEDLTASTDATTGATIVGEQHFYLQQPGYGTSYIIGKVQIEHLLAERANQLGDAFTLKTFMDEFSAAGVIPVSLARWQLTGEGEEVAAMTSGGTP